MIPAAWRMTWVVLRAHWGTLTLIVVCAHWPLDALESLITYNWMDPENLRTTLKVSRAIDQFLRVIPDGAIFCVVHRALNGDGVGLGSSLAEGMRSYGRMWVTRFLDYLALFTICLLVVPGVYLLTRWAFNEASVIGEEKIGTSAFERSLQLTRGAFWSVFGALLAGGVVYAACCGLIVFAFSLAAEDTWWLDALTNMLCSLLLPLWMTYLFCLYAYRIAATEAVASTNGAPDASIAGA
jgi:hypothetical protein